MNQEQLFANTRFKSAQPCKGQACEGQVQYTQRTWRLLNRTSSQLVIVCKLEGGIPRNIVPKMLKARLCSIRGCNPPQAQAFAQFPSVIGLFVPHEPVCGPELHQQFLRAHNWIDSHRLVKHQIQCSLAQSYSKGARQKQRLVLRLPSSFSLPIPCYFILTSATENVKRCKVLVLKHPHPPLPFKIYLELRCDAS